MKRLGAALRLFGQSMAAPIRRPWLLLYPLAAFGAIRLINAFLFPVWTEWGNYFGTLWGPGSFGDTVRYAVAFWLWHWVVVACSAAVMGSVLGKAPHRVVAGRNVVRWSLVATLAVFASLYLPYITFYFFLDGLSFAIVLGILAFAVLGWLLPLYFALPSLLCGDSTPEDLYKESQDVLRSRAPEVVVGWAGLFALLWALTWLDLEIRDPRLLTGPLQSGRDYGWIMYAFVGGLAGVGWPLMLVALLGEGSPIRGIDNFPFVLLAGGIYLSVVRNVHVAKIYASAQQVRDG